MYIKRNTSKDTKSNQLTGMNIYHDEKGRCIYRNPIFKKAVYIAPTDYKSFRIYQQRFFIALCAAILVFTFINRMIIQMVLISLALFAVIYGFFEFRLYQLVSHCNEVKFEKEKLKGSLDDQATQSYNVLYGRMIAIAVIGVLLVVNSYMQNYSNTIKIASFVVMVGCVIYIIYMGRIVLYKKKNNL